MIAVWGPAPQFPVLTDGPDCSDVFQCLWGNHWLICWLHSPRINVYPFQIIDYPAWQAVKGKGVWGKFRHVRVSPHLLVCLSPPCASKIPILFPFQHLPVTQANKLRLIIKRTLLSCRYDFYCNGCVEFTTYLKPCVCSKSLVFFVVLSSYSFFFLCRDPAR